MTGAVLAGAAAILVLVVACVRVAKATAGLRQELDELKARERLAPPVEAQPGNRPRPMMGAMYAERASLLDALDGVPAWPGFALGAALAILAVVLGVVGGVPAGSPTPDSPASSPPASDHAAELAATRAAMDSVLGELAKLRDSLRLAASSPAPSPPRPAIPASRTTRRPSPNRAAARPSSSELPPAPQLLTGHPPSR